MHIHRHHNYCRQSTFKISRCVVAVFGACTCSRRDDPSDVPSPYFVRVRVVYFFCWVSGLITPGLGDPRRFHNAFLFAGNSTMLTGREEEKDFFGPTVVCTNQYTSLNISKKKAMHEYISRSSILTNEMPIIYHKFPEKIS